MKLLKNKSQWLTKHYFSLRLSSLIRDNDSSSNQYTFVQFQNSDFLKHQQSFMKKKFLLPLFVIITLNAQSQNDNKIVIGKVNSVNSKILKETKEGLGIYTGYDLRQ